MPKLKIEFNLDNAVFYGIEGEFIPFSELNLIFDRLATICEQEYDFNKLDRNIYDSNGNKIGKMELIED